jgi:hypothetical protein
VGTQLGHHPGHLGGLDVKIGLGLGGLGGETTNMLHLAIDEPKKTVITLLSRSLPVAQLVRMVWDKHKQ